MKNKKSMIQVYSIIIGVVLGMAAYYTVDYHYEINHFIGYYSFQIKKAQIQAENLDFYLRNSAKYSYEKTLSQISNTGANADSNEISDTRFVSGCGSFKDAKIWIEVRQESGSAKIKDCFEETEITINFEEKFRQNFESYVSIHPKNILLDRFTYEILDDVISAKSSQVIEIEIRKKDQILTEEIRTNFEENPKVLGKQTEFTGTILCPKGKTCSLSSEAYSLFEKAQQEAEKKNVQIQLVDGYRSVDEQKYLWNKWALKIPDESERRKYVCYPYGDDVEKRCPHLSGNAVDVRLVGRSMNSNDWKILEEVMLSSGWVRYEKEPWHFECCGTPRFARAKEQGVGVIA